MLEVTDKKKKSSWRWILIFTGSGGIFFVILLASYGITFAKRVIPGVTLGNIPIGGMTVTELETTLSRIERRITSGFIFEFTDKEGEKQSLTITPEIYGFDNPVADAPLFVFDKERFVRQAFSYGRTDGWKNNLREHFVGITRGITIPLDLAWNHKSLNDLIKIHLNDYTVSPKNAELKLIKNSDGTISSEIIPERDGSSFDYARIITKMEHWIASGNTRPIPITLNIISPKIRREEIPDLTSEINVILALPPIRVSVATETEDAGKTWEIGRELLLESIQLSENTETYKIILALNETKIIDFLKIIAAEVNKEPQNARFAIENGKVVEFSASHNGKILPLQSSFSLINEAIITLHDSSVTLPLETAEAEYTTATVNDFGITEIIGFGISNFAGSPANRVHNIMLGATALDGILIAPDEEFSLGSSLGPIELETGYLPELVIKGNRTTPEVGGGLCQTGTTIFRATLDAGLPITERQNHSFTVSYYYENGVPGTDATIYPPHPDFRFINDTKHHILIQTSVVGTELRFEFWGTRDGRVAERTIPKLSNRIAPGATRIIETTDLKPGEKKCTEKPHAGVTAEFDYTVTYQDSTIKKQTFKSVYKPWQEVCLIGAENKEGSVLPDETAEQETLSSPEAVQGSETQKSE